MTPLSISVKNIIRRRSKSIFIILAMMIASASIVAVKTYSDGMKISITHHMEKFGANIIITPGMSGLDIDYGGLELGTLQISGSEIKEEDFERITDIKNYGNIAAAGPLVIGITEISGIKVILKGIDFSSKNILRPWWEIVGAIPSEGEILAGSSAASLLNIKKGDSLIINGHVYLVSGILDYTGSTEDSMVFADITTGQRILGKEELFSMIEVAALCAGCPIEEMVRQLQEVFPGADVRSIKKVVESRFELLKHVGKMIYGITALLIFLCGLVVVISMMSSVNQRSSEIGTFIAIGFKRIQIIRFYSSCSLGEIFYCRR